MNVGLIGFFGWGNFGDELFFQEWTKVLGHGNCFRANDLLKKPYFTSTAAAVAAKSSALIIGGGDLIRIEAISSLYWNRAWLARPIAISGIGVAEESGFHRPDVVPRLREFFHKANILSLSARDVRSKNWIESTLDPAIPVRLVPDIAFGVDFHGDNRCSRDGRRSTPTIGLALGKFVSDREVELIGALVAAHTNRSIRLRVLVLAAGVQLADELALLRALQLENRAEVFATVDEMIDAIGGLDLLYSAKFHGLIVAAGHGIPSYSLRTTSKAVSLAESCQLVGLLEERTWRLRDALQRIGEAVVTDEIAAWGQSARTEVRHVAAAVEEASVRGIKT